MTEDRDRLIDEIAEAERVKARAYAELFKAQNPDIEPAAGFEDLPDMLTTSQAAKALGFSKSWVLDHLAELDARRYPNGHNRIPKTAVIRYLATRTEQVEP